MEKEEYKNHTVIKLDEKDLKNMIAEELEILTYDPNAIIFAYSPEYGVEAYVNIDKRGHEEQKRETE